MNRNECSYRVVCASTPRLVTDQLDFIVSRLNFNSLVFERLFILNGESVLALVFPAAHVEAALVVAFSFALFGLVFLAEVTTARFLAVESVDSNELTHCEEVLETKSLFELDVYAVDVRNKDVLLEFLLEFSHLIESGL